MEFGSNVAPNRQELRERGRAHVPEQESGYLSVKEQPVLLR